MFFFDKNFWGFLFKMYIFILVIVSMLYFIIPQFLFFIKPNIEIEVSEIFQKSGMNLMIKFLAFSCAVRRQK